MFVLVAAEDAAHGAQSTEVMAFNWLPGVTALVVFLLAFGILYVKVWPRIVGGLEDRERKIREEIKAAEEAREQARAAQAEYQRQLEEARQETSRMISKAKADAKTVAQELRDRNEAELTDMKQRAAREIEQAKSAAVAELHAEAVTLATDIAGRILKREISAEDQKRLIDESLEEVAGAT